MGIVRHNECIHVIDGKLADESIQQRIRDSVYTGGMAVGLSWRFKEPTRIAEAYAQADAAIRLAPNDEDDTLHNYSRVNGRFVLEKALAASHLAEDAFLMPEIQALAGMDQNDGRERLQDLACYLACGRSISRAAKSRNVHKNSMYYRLNRLQELTGLDLEDDETCSLLSFSLMLLGYLPLADG